MPPDPENTNYLEKSHNHRPAKAWKRPKPQKKAIGPYSFYALPTSCSRDRQLLTRLSHIKTKLIKDQAGFRPGKSCSGQVLNLTRYIEDGCQKKLIIGVAFVDLSVAYDTIQHRLLIKKLFDMTADATQCNVIRCLLSNQMFCHT